MNAKYDVIYADPPWRYNSRANHKTRFRGGACGHYDLMKTADICALHVGDLAADDAVLLMWATFPMLSDALKVIEAWGFEYKTIGFLWVKENANTRLIQAYENYEKDIIRGPFYDELMPWLNIKPCNWLQKPSYFFGVGYYTKSNPEPCLLATRGRALKPARNDVSNLIIAPRRKHSQKPWEAAYRIEALWPSARRLELFARDKRPGWDVWGNEVESDIELRIGT